MMLKSLLILSCFLFSNISSATDYPVLSDMQLCSRDLQTISIDGLSLKTRFYSKENCFQNAVFVYDHMTYASKMILNYSEKVLGWKLQDCNLNTNLSIYEIEKSDLNDHFRFKSWWQGHPEVKELFGLYDPQESVIIFSPRDTKEYGGLVAHEMAHYWYDRMCWTNHVPLDTEQFAKQMQDLYQEMFISVTP